MSAPALKGLVLTGGRSARMGQDKAALSLGSESMLDHAVCVLRTVADDVLVSARSQQADLGSRSKYTVVTDEHADIGPAAGLFAAHKYDATAAWLVLAVDMPRVDAALLGELVAARAPECAATAWRSGRGEAPEPLCTIYEPATLAAFAASVAKGGSPSAQGWLAQQDIKLLTPPASEVLLSTNTQEDFERYVAATGRDE